MNRLAPERRPRRQRGSRICTAVGLVALPLALACSFGPATYDGPWPPDMPQPEGGDDGSGDGAAGDDTGDGTSSAADSRVYDGAGRGDAGSGGSDATGGDGSSHSDAAGTEADSAGDAADSAGDAGNRPDAGQMPDTSSD
jgi:hypothetical protein